MRFEASYNAVSWIFSLAAFILDTAQTYTSRSIVAVSDSPGPLFERKDTKTNNQALCLAPV